MKNKLQSLLLVSSKLMLHGILSQVFFIGVLIANDGLAQKKSVKHVFIPIHEKDASVINVFEIIEKETAFKFMYDRDHIDNEVRMTIAGQKSVKEILLEIAKEAQIHFKQIDNTIYVKPVDKPLARGEKTEAYFPAILISGKVTELDSDEGLPGVSILIKGTSRGTVTDINGNYQIEVPSGESTLVFSSVGFLSEEIVVGDRTEINIDMMPDVLALNEIVVVGYGTQKRSEVTSSVATVKSENFNAGGTRSPMDLIQGKVAGLNIVRTQGNNPNTGADIQLRGVTSLTGTKSPLIVIDGIPGGNLDLLQQDDIESMDVLKDGSAAAIYGTRGNAGVILITTKKGVSGEPKFHYATYFQHESIDQKPDYLTADEYRGLISQGLVGADQDFGSSTDLYDELIDKQNLSQYHNFAASGGTSKANYRASIYYNDANGIAKQNTRRQFGGRLNINHYGLKDKLELQLNLATNFNKANLLGGKTGDFEQAIQRNPTSPIYNPDGTFLETQAFNNYNPMSRLAYRVEERNQQTFSGDARIRYEIIEGLSATAFGAYVRDNFNDRLFRSLNDWDQRPGAQFQGMGYASKSNHLSWTETFESTIDYRRLFKDHSVTTMLGYSYQYSTTENFNVNNNGFTTDAFLDWNLGAGSAINNDQLPRPGMGSQKFDNTLIAFFGRINYTYQGKYFAQAILRHEGSSRFGANNKWGTFPAVSAGWTLSEENFIKGLSAVNNLKLRVGYGVTGNQGIPNYQSLVTLSTGGVYPQDGIYSQTYGAARNPNPDLRWERKGEWNFGLDFSVFDNRIGGSIDVYNRLTTDLLFNYNAQQPPFLRDRLYTNVGSIRNKGVEMLISVIPVKKEALEWRVDITANSQNNKLERLSNDVFEANWLEFSNLPSPGNLGAAIRLEEGGAVGNFYGKRFAGFDEDGKWLFYRADGSTGSVTEMTEDDLTVLGNGVPKYVAAISNTVRYRQFDLTVFFRGKFAYEILNAKEIYFGNKKWLPNNLLKTAITRHAALDDDPQYSDYYLEDGSFVKLDNVTLGYSPQLKNAGIYSLRVYFTGRNLATFTGYSGIDPELQDTGFDTGIDGRSFYPRTRSWTLGLNVEF